MFERSVSARYVREYQSGEVILDEGSRPDCFFVILTGAVDISQRRKSVRFLEDGDIFGLESFFFQRPSTVRARAVGRSRIATYGYDAITDILYSRPQMAERMLVSALKQLEQTTQIAEENLKNEAVADINMLFFKDGDVIIREGEEKTEIFKLVSTEGGLEVSKEGQKIAVIREPEEIFGEMSGILKQPRSATIKSIGRSVVQVYPRDDIEGLVEENPSVARRIIETLASRLAEANRLLTSKS